MNEATSKLPGDKNPLEFLRQLSISEDGETADILIGHSIELYCEDGWTVEKRKAMVALIGDYQRSLGDRITHYHPRDSRRLKKIGDVDWLGYFRHLAETVKADDDEGFDATVYGFEGGEDADAATPYFCCVIGSPNYKRYSRANAYYPADQFQSDEGFDRYIKLMQHWCSLLRVSHGTAGFSIILEEGQPKDRGVRKAFPLLKRFPGLDLPYSSRWSSSVRRAEKRYIRTINWLTAIDDEFVAQLGGLERVRSRLGDDIPIHPYDGGIIIQAGPRPEIGDTNRGLIPPHYRTVAKLLEPLVFENFNPKQPYVYAPKPLDSFEETLNWIRRFNS